MPKNALTRLTIVLLLAVLCSGCAFNARTLSGTAYDLEREIPGAQFDAEFQLTLGRVSLGLAKKIVNLAVDEEEEDEIAFLRKIKRVEMATYETRRLPELPSDMSFPGDRTLRKKGWNVIVSTTADDGASWVYMREKNGRPHELMVAALDDDELVLIKVRGDLRSMVEQVLDENVVDVPGVVHADLEPEEGEPIAVVESDA